MVDNIIASDAPVREIGVFSPPKVTFSVNRNVMMSRVGSRANTLRAACASRRRASLKHSAEVNDVTFFHSSCTSSDFSTAVAACERATAVNETRTMR